MYSWKSGVSEWPGSVVVFFCSLQGNREDEKGVKKKVLSGKSWGTAVGNGGLGEETMATAGMSGELPINPAQHDLSTEEGNWEGALSLHRDAHEGTTVSLSDAECPPSGGRCPRQPIQSPGVNCTQQCEDHTRFGLDGHSCRQGL